MFKNDMVACINAGVPAISIVSPEWERVCADITNIALNTGLEVVKWDNFNGLMQGDQYLVDASNPLAPMAKLEEVQDTIAIFMNYNLPMKHPAVQQKIRDILPHCKANGVLICFVSVSGEIPAELEKEILVFDYDLPDREAIQKIIDNLMADGLGDNTELLGRSVGDTEAGLDADYFDQMVDAAAGLTQSEAENYIAMALAKNNLTLNENAVEDVKRQKAQSLKKTGVLELYEPENLPKVGGLDELKLWLWERGKAFSAKAREFGLPFPKGILVFGIPGTGKSLIAKTIAKQWDMQLLVMGNVMDKYVGESEKRMKEALKQAEAMAPCVLMVDEVEKFFAGVGESSDSGVSTRVFGQFLTFMQETKKPVFVVATANNIQGMPPEFIRKGRFDEVFFVDLPGDNEREEIFRIHLSAKKRNPDEFDLGKLVQATPGYTGSEIEQVVIAGLYRAFSRGKDINTEILLEAAKETAPLSVTMAESIRDMRKWGQQRARLASSIQEEPEKKVSAFTAARRIRTS
jgi:SpoVK/Ycf46/Vps4 family AAA+-type ATPase